MNAGADVNGIEQENLKPLHSAIDNGKTEILFGNFTFFVIIIFISYTMNNSNLIPSLLELGISATQQGKFKEAKEFFLKVIDLNDNI